MKAEATTSTPKFEPVTLTLTFETKEELESFYAIMSHGRILKGGEFSDAAYEIRDAILNCAADIKHGVAFSKLDNHLSCND